MGAGRDAIAPRERFTRSAQTILHRVGSGAKRSHQLSAGEVAIWEQTGPHSVTASDLYRVLTI